MKTFLIVFLVIAVGLLAFDEKVQRGKSADAAKELQDAEDRADQATSQAQALLAQVEQLKMQIATVPTPQKTTQAAVSAPVVQPVAPQQVAPVALLPSTQLMADNSSTLVVIAGKNGGGCGFLCNMDGHTYVVTTAHILCENPGFTMSYNNGTPLTPGASAVAVGRDLVRIEVTGVPKTLDLLADITKNVKIGDDITILAGGGDTVVMRPLDGRVTGVGPDLVETDANFVEANSGSPMIDRRSGKVLGMATYISTHKIVQTGLNPVEVQILRFGGRLDGITQWEPINWQAFYAQSAQLTDVQTLSNDFIKLFNEGGRMNFNASNYSSPILQRTIREFVQSIQEGGKNLSAADRKTLVDNFIAGLRSVTHADIMAFNKNTAYDYFRRGVEEQGRFRDALYEGLTRVMQNNL